MTDKTEIILIALEQEAPEMESWDNVFFTGVGKVNATMLATNLLDRFPHVTKVWNFGTAGGITTDQGGLHKCTKFIQRDMLCTVKGVVPGETPFDGAPAVIDFGDSGLTCSTGDNFVTDPTAPLLGDLVDMEAYAIAKVCLRMGVEFECWKYISDKANEDGGDDWAKNVANGEPHFIQKYNEQLNG